MPTSLAAMLALINDNTSGDISAADVRTVVQGLWDWVPKTEQYKMGRMAGETAHASDDFFTAYSGYTEQAPSGTVTWAATRAGLGCKFISVASANLAVTLKAIPAAGVPTTIETCINTSTWRQEANPGAGLIFTNGTGSGATFSAFGIMHSSAAQSGISMPTGTLNSVTSGLASLGNMFAGPQIFIRHIWSAANTFKVAISSDGQLWTDFSQTTFARTLTPTHMGFYVTNWGLASDCQVTFNYLRVYDADLGV